MARSVDIAKSINPGQVIESSTLQDLAGSPAVAAVDVIIPQSPVGRFLNSLLTIPGIGYDLKIQRLYRELDLPGRVKDELIDEGPITELVAAYKFQQFLIERFQYIQRTGEVAELPPQILTEGDRIIAEDYIDARAKLTLRQEQIVAEKSGYANGLGGTRRRTAGLERVQTKRLTPEARAEVEVGKGFEELTDMLRAVAEGTNDVKIMDYDVYRYVKAMEDAKEVLAREYRLAPVDDKKPGELVNRTDLIREKMEAYLHDHPEDQTAYSNSLRTAALEHITLATGDMESRVEANKWAEGIAYTKLAFRLARRAALLGVTGLVYNQIINAIGEHFGFSTSDFTFSATGKGILEVATKAIGVAFGILFVLSLIKAGTEAWEDNTSRKKGKERRSTYRFYIGPWIDMMAGEVGLSPRYTDSRYAEALFGGLHARYRVVDGQLVEITTQLPPRDPDEVKKARQEEEKRRKAQKSSRKSKPFIPPTQGDLARRAQAAYVMNNIAPLF